MYDIRKDPPIAKRSQIKTISGWISSPSCNAPVWGFKAQVIYSNSDGTRLVVGEGFSKRSKKAAEEKAIKEASLLFHTKYGRGK